MRRRRRRRLGPVTAQGIPPAGPTEGGPGEQGAEPGRVVESTDAHNGSSEHRTLLDIAALVAPASLLTGLGIYFGFLHTHAFYRYLNIDASVLGFSTTDYLIRSVNGFLVPVAVLALAALAFGLAHVGLEAALSSGRHGSDRLRRVPQASVVVGILLVLNAIVTLIRGSGALFSPYLVAPASMCVGVFLTVSGLRLTDVGKQFHKVPRRHLYGIVTVSGILLVVGAMWGTAQYADATGRNEARSFVRYLDNRPAVVIHSGEPLGINLKEDVITSTPRQSSYRYSGARLVLWAGGKYLFLTEGWSQDRGWAILLHDEPGTRVEFTAHQPFE